jgi:Mg-chelatase subunit ChlD
MSLDWNKLSPEERDARLTSLLLGELPPNEAEELRAIIGTDAELARACVRRGRTISLLREAAAAQGQAAEPAEAEVAAPARLSNERREKLLETFKSAPPVPAERVRWRLQMPQWFLPMSAAAIFIGLLTFVATTLFSRRSRVTTAALTNLSGRGYYDDNITDLKLPSGGRPSFAAKMEKAQADMARRSPIDPRVQVSGQVAIQLAEASDFSDQVEFKNAEVAKSSPRFAIVLPDAENKERGRQLGREGEALADFDSDPSKSATLAEAGYKVAANSDNYFAGTATPRASGIANLNGREAKPTGGESFEFRTKFADQGMIVGGVPAPVPQGIADFTQSDSKAGKALQPPPVATPAPAKPESEVVQSTTVDSIKSDAAKAEGITIIRSQSAGQVQAAGSYITINNFAVADPAPALPATAPMAFSAKPSENIAVNEVMYASTNAGVSYSDQVGHFTASLNDSLSARAILQNPIPLPATAPTFNNGSAIVSSGGDQTLRELNWKEEKSFGTRPGAGASFEGRTGFGRALNNEVTRREGDQGKFKSESAPGRTLNEGLAGVDDRFGLNINDPVALGDQAPSIQAKFANVAQEPKAETTVSEGFLSYYDGAQLPARPAVNQQVRGLGVDSPSEPAGSLPTILREDDVPAGAQDREWSVRGFGGIGGGAMSGAANRPANGEGFGNRSGGSTVDFERNRMYAGTPTGKSPFPQAIQQRSFRVDTKTLDSSLQDVSAFTFSESQFGGGGGGGGRGSRRVAGGRGNTRNPVPTDAPQNEDSLSRTESAPATVVSNAQNFFKAAGVDLTIPGKSMALDAASGVLTVQATPAELETVSKAMEMLGRSQAQGKVDGKVQMPGDVGGPVPGVDAAGLPLAAVSEKRKELSDESIDAKTPKPSAQAPVPQPEVLSKENAFSTFSLNVSDVSFKLAAASLEKGAMPDAANIRSEEFINAFDYRDPMPLPGAPLAFAWERARYPFAHNRDVVRFSVKTAAQGREAGKPLNIVVLLDNSGSMERADRVRIIQESLRTLAAQLKPQDKISVVTFARTASLRVDGVSGTNAIDVADKVGVLTPEGGTNLEEALDLAYRTARRHYEATAVNRVVLLTDGAANLGNVEPKALKAKVENYRKQGIALDCFGIGWEGFNDDLLEQLSRNGDGRYGFVNTPEEAASEFVGQLAGALRVAASDVKMQVEFNPKRVTAWRQIGYAKHQLTKEQFRDNKVDAAEIGAAESGNALYVIETNPNGEGPVATVRARFRVPQTSDYREHEWVVPFGSAVELQQAAPSLRLAASGSAFSEWLAASPFAGEVSTDRLLQILSGVPETYGADPRPKRLEWMIRQAKSISGK